MACFGTDAPPQAVEEAKPVESYNLHTGRWSPLLELVLYCLKARHYSLDGATTTAVVKGMAGFVALQWARRAVPPATAASRWSRFADPDFFMLLYDSRCGGFSAVGECAAGVCAESFYVVCAGRMLCVPCLATRWSTRGSSRDGRSFI